jgi:hypothetical protein
VTRELAGGFLTGAAAGVLAVATTLLLRALVPARAGLPPIGGVALLVGVGVGFAASEGLPGLLLTALVVAALAGGLAEVLGWPPAAAAPLALPAGVLVVAAAPAGTRPWASVLAGTSVVVMGGLLSDVDRRWRDSGLVWPLLAVTAAGVFLTVPDTEHAVALAGATSVLVLLGRPVPLAALGTPGAFVASAVVAWVALQGGVGRPASVVAALACWGLLAFEPLVRSRPPGVVPAAGVHGAVVLAVARVAGRGADPAVAAALAALFLAAGAVAWRRLAVAGPR